MPEKMELVVKEETPTSHKVIGGGAIAFLIWWLFFRGRSGHKPDSKPLHFHLLSDGRLYLRGVHLVQMKAYTPSAAIARVKEGKRDDVILTVAGDVNQGSYDAVKAAFIRDGIKVSSEP